MIASYERFDYLIRPAKQIERKLLLEGMHTLSSYFDIREYRYVGLGSPFYADFMLFHRYLYIHDMLCIERRPIKKRMRFNKPFPTIKLKYGEVSEIIPGLDRHRPHVVWLDYDYPLTKETLDDLSGLSTVLAEESIVLITIEADPRVPNPNDLPSETIDEIRAYRREAVDNAIGGRIDGGVKLLHMTETRLPLLYAEVLLNYLSDKLSVRSLMFYPMFNFVYADGRQMLSLGGMVGTRKTRAKIKKSGFFELPFASRSRKTVPTLISAPPLTVRERLWLDQNASNRDPSFEVPNRVVKHYRRYYRYYPNYFEALF